MRDINKIEKKNSIWISVFGCENKGKHQIYVSKKCCEEKHVDLLLIGQKGKRDYTLIKDFNTFMYDHTFRGRKHFCRCCLRAFSFSSEEILKSHINGCFKIKGKQRMIMPYERKIMSLLIIYVDFETILVPQNNGKQNPNEFSTNKYQKHVALVMATTF